MSAATLTRIHDVLKKIGFGLSRDYGEAQRRPKGMAWRRRNPPSRPWPGFQNPVLGLTRLSQLKQKSQQYQRRVPKSLHYRAGAAA